MNGSLNVFAIFSSCNDLAVATVSKLSEQITFQIYFDFLADLLFYLL